MHALNSIQARPNFREIASTTNEYSQTLAHLAILYDYPALLRHLVDWSIDLAIPDVNGLTALHFAYMKGDLHTVRILRRGGAPEDARDKLGRIPSELWPKGCDRDFDIDAEVHPTDPTLHLPLPPLPILDSRQTNMATQAPNAINL